MLIVPDLHERAMYKADLPYYFIKTLPLAKDTQQDDNVGFSHKLSLAAAMDVALMKKNLELIRIYNNMIITNKEPCCQRLPASKATLVSGLSKVEQNSSIRNLVMIIKFCLF